ncbi:MAG: hypothetical protein WAJ91_07170, partial [Rhodoplanes sp.]
HDEEDVRLLLLLLRLSLLLLRLRLLLLLLRLLWLSLLRWLSLLLSLLSGRRRAGCSRDSDQGNQTEPNPLGHTHPLSSSAFAV